MYELCLIHICLYSLVCLNGVGVGVGGGVGGWMCACVCMFVYFIIWHCTDEPQKGETASFIEVVCSCMFYYVCVCVCMVGRVHVWMDLCSVCSLSSPSEPVGEVTQRAHMALSTFTDDLAWCIRSYRHVFVHVQFVLVHALWVPPCMTMRACCMCGALHAGIMS